MANAKADSLLAFFAAAAAMQQNPPKFHTPASRVASAVLMTQHQKKDNTAHAPRAARSTAPKRGRRRACMCGFEQMQCSWSTHRPSACGGRAWPGRRPAAFSGLKLASCEGEGTAAHLRKRDPRPPTLVTAPATPCCRRQQRRRWGREKRGWSGAHPRGRGRQCSIPRGRNAQEACCSRRGLRASHFGPPRNKTNGAPWRQKAGAGPRQPPRTRAPAFGAWAPARQGGGRGEARHLLPRKGRVTGFDDNRTARGFATGPGPSSKKVTPWSCRGYCSSHGRAFGPGAASLRAGWHQASSPLPGACLSGRGGGPGKHRSQVFSSARM